MGEILAINAGSSSLRIAVFDGDTPRLREKLEHPGEPGEATALAWLAAHLSGAAPVAMSHRIVHGMLRSEPALITPALVAELHANIPYAPEHMPRQLALIEACARQYPGVPQFACFDTAFHVHMPRVATQLPLPRRFEAEGLRRYGFHGLSCEYLLTELTRLDPQAAEGKIILAHLGNGASLTAVKYGSSFDTTMSFTPAGGLMMGTRTGDLDPGIASYLVSEGLTAPQFDHLVNHESGLLGVSETSADVRNLIPLAPTDPRAAEALNLFCYGVRKGIGAMAAALSGLDTLVFAGGIGENSPLIRHRICNTLQFLGLHLDDKRNANNSPVISSPESRVTIRVIPTDEELMLARHARSFLQTRSPKGS